MSAYFVSQRGRMAKATSYERDFLVTYQRGDISVDTHFESADALRQALHEAGVPAFAYADGGYTYGDQTWLYTKT